MCNRYTVYTRQVDGQVDSQADKQSNSYIKTYTQICMHGWMDVWMYGFVDVWMYACTNICMHAHVCMYILHMRVQQQWSICQADVVTPPRPHAMTQGSRDRCLSNSSQEAVRILKPGASHEFQGDF